MAMAKPNWDRIKEQQFSLQTDDVAKQSRISFPTLKDKITEMYECANSQDWNGVEQILLKKPYLVNVIPEKETLGLLHLAAYQGDRKAIEILVKNNKRCDKWIKVKGGNKRFKAGMTPHELAQKYNKGNLNLLKPQTQIEVFGHQNLNPEIGKTFLEENVRYFAVAVASLDETEIGRMTSFEKCGLKSLTEKMYVFLQRKWRYVQRTVVNSLAVWSSIRKLGEKTDRTSFKKEMIKVYTEEGPVYQLVNAALRRAANRENNADDNTVAVYSLFLFSILFHWDKLPKFTGTTYRGVPKQVKLYPNGTTFHWLPLTSSSKIRAKAEEFASENPSEGTLFRIDNSEVSSWSPREIGKCSKFPEEDEVVYPCLAKFEVKKYSRKGNLSIIDIELIKD